MTKRGRGRLVAVVDMVAAMEGHQVGLSARLVGRHYVTSMQLLRPKVGQKFCSSADLLLFSLNAHKGYYGEQHHST